MTAELSPYLIVAVIPEVTLQAEASIQLLEKDQLLLNCSATEGWRQPSLSWLLYGALILQSSGRVGITSQISEEDSGLFSVYSSLSIMYTLTEDSGVYTCRADLNIPDIPTLARSTNVTVQGLQKICCSMIHMNFYHLLTTLQHGMTAS